MATKRKDKSRVVLKTGVFRKINVMVLRLKHDTQPLMNYLTFGQI